MAKNFSLSAGNLIDIGGGTGLEQIDVEALPQIDVGRASEASFDFEAQIQRMTRAAEEEQQREEPGFQLLAMDMDLGLLDFKSDGLLSKTDRLLGEARALADEGRYEEALPILEEILLETPHHQEAGYLQGLCLGRLDRPRECLECLHVLTQGRLPPRLQKKVTALRKEMGPKLANRTILEFLLLSQTLGHKAAARKVEDCIRLVPDHPLLYFLAGGAHMMAGELDQAKSTVDRGLAACTGEGTSELDRLKKEIERRLAHRELQPALKKFKAGDYGGARQALDTARSRCGQARVWELFHEYVTQLARSRASSPRRRKPLPEPPGDTADKECLHAFIVAEEIDHTKRYMAKEKFREAEATMQDALRHTPHYPFANFLYATAIYRHFVDQCHEGNPPEPAEALKDMEQALASAQIGATDPEIREGTVAVKVIGQIVKMLKDAATAEAEMAELAEAAKEYNAVMEKAKGGIRSESQFRTVHTRMKALQRRLPAIGRGLKGTHSREQFKMLSDAVDKNCEQLASIEDDIESQSSVEALIGRFNAVMESVKAKGGISSHHEARELKRGMQDLASQVTSELRTAKGSQAKKALKDLAEAIGTVIGQLPV